MKRFVVLYFVFSVFCFNAQNAESDISKANSTLLATENLYMDIEYKVYANHFTTKPLEVSYGVLKQNKNNIYRTISNVQSLLNDKVNISVDTADRVVIVGDPVDMTKQKNDAMRMDVKAMMSKCSKIGSQEISKNVVVYHLEYGDDVESEIDRCDIYIDRNLSLVTKLILYYSDEFEMDDEAIDSKKESPRLEITYKNIDMEPKFKASDFDEDRFISRSGGKIKPSEHFKGYRLIDNRYYTRAK
jgi:hypothetical protein